MRRQRPDGSLAQLGEHLPYKQRVTAAALLLFGCAGGLFGVFTGAGCGTKCGSKNQWIETTFFCVFFLLSVAKLSTFNEAFVNASSERCV